MKLIDFEDMSATFHKIAVLVYNSFFAQAKKLFRLFEGYFLLEFVTRKTTINRFPLDCQIAFAVANAYTNSIDGCKISLSDMTDAVRLTLPVHIFMDKKLAFNFQSAAHHAVRVIAHAIKMRANIMRDMAIHLITDFASFSSRASRAFFLNLFLLLIVILFYAKSPFGFSQVTIYNKVRKSLSIHLFYSSSSGNSIKYALIKPSILPSITPSTSEVW